MKIICHREINKKYKISVELEELFSSPFPSPPSLSFSLYLSLTLSYSSRFSLFPRRLVHRISPSTSLADVIRGSRYRFRIIPPGGWRNLIGGYVIPSSIRAAARQEKNTCRAASSSRKVRTASKLARGKNFPVKATTSKVATPFSPAL